MANLTKTEKLEILENGIGLLGDLVELLQPLADDDPNFNAYAFASLADALDGRNNPYNQNLCKMADEMQVEIDG